MNDMISGRHLIERAFLHQALERIPWVPFAGVHAGSLKHYTAMEILKDSNKLLESLREVNKLYQPDGLPVLFDLQVEAEILGCKLRWADKAPPSVKTHPLANVDMIPEHLPGKDEGRLPMILDVMHAFGKEVGDDTALFGLVTGPLTLCSHLRGTKLFMDLLKNVEHVNRLLNYASNVGKVMCDYYIDAGMDVIAIVDPVVSQVSPAVFNRVLSSHFSSLFSYIREKGTFSSFFVCGDATKNIEPMCKTGPDAIFIDENIDIISAKSLTDQYNITIGGNIPLTSVLLYGTQRDCMKYVLDLIDKIGERNFIIAPGCDVPYDVPPDNMVGVAQAVNEPDLVRKTLINYQVTELDEEIELPDYDSLDKLLIEVFTIDSSTCAACGYMKTLAFTALEEFKDSVEVREYKATLKENIIRARLLEVSHLPSILFNGKVMYSSLIPSKQEYFRKINEHLKMLNR
ncbi:MAG: uroporphyrinogen decarboxylase family protein [Promethearchaeota archaeon]